MGHARQPLGHLRIAAWAAALAVMLTGCQSMRTTHTTRKVSSNEAYAQAPHAPSKSRWSIPWKSNRAEEPEARAPLPETAEAATHPATVVSAERKSRPVLRLISPTRSSRQTQARMDGVPVTTTHGRMPSATDVVLEVPEENGLSHEMRSRMERIFLASATLPGDSMPIEESVRFAADEEKGSLDVQVEEESPMIDDEPALMHPIMESEESEGILSPAGIPVITEPLAAGVDRDRRGLWDNLIGRLGAAGYDNDFNTEWGFLATGETTHQWCDSNWFTHMGVAGVGYDEHTSSSFSVGVSRLAKIVGKKVEKPWIFGLAYDGLWDDGLFGSDQSVYVDQMRGLIGYAICPRWDMGVWAAGGLTEDTVVLSTPTYGPNRTFTAGLGNRVAGYTAWNWFQTGIFNITSVGYQDNLDGNFFVESDVYVPLTAAVNFFAGGGYSDAFGGSSDISVGLEFVWGRTWVARAVKRHFCGKTLPKVGMLASDTMPKGSFIRQIDPCCVRYRGGWANDAYRSAFRVETPVRLERRIDLRVQPVPTVNGGIVGDPIIDPGPNGEEVCPDVNPNPLEQTIPRDKTRPTRPSRLSEYQEVNGPRNELMDCPTPISTGGTKTSAVSIGRPSAI